MRKRVITIGCTSVLVLAAAGFNVPDDAPSGAATPRESRADSPATQPAAPNANHEPGKVAGVMPRDPKADPKLIDLSKSYTLGLDEDASGVYGYSLKVLPRGVQKLGDVQYDLRGIVQLSSQQFVAANKSFPEAVKGIPVGLKCHTLRFLHASRWTEQNGATIGRYVVHYADGQTRDVPIVFGADLRDWRPGWDPGAANAPAGPAVAWHAKDAGEDVVLFVKQWANPLPGVEVESLDMVSTMTNAAPFLVAVTAQ
jgi:hypothetical protein